MPAIRSSPAKAPQRLGGKRAPAVERAFATMKRRYGMGQIRYLGLARNACHAVRRHGDEHETGARADARCLIRSQEEIPPRSPGKRTIAGQNGQTFPTHPTKPVIATSTHRSQ